MPAQLILFIFLTLVLFLFTQQSLKNLYQSLRVFFKNKRIVFILLSLIYFPGTILHEIAHFLTALVTGLKVANINIFPTFQENTIRLGEVHFEKKDFVRSILVGVAPFFFGLGFFIFLSYFKLFPSQTVLSNILFGYLVFSVSSTMFSSKEDLEDIVYLIPLAIIIYGIIYVFDIRLNFASGEFLELTVDFIKLINFYVLLSIVVNVVFIIVSRLVMIILRKR